MDSRIKGSIRFIFISWLISVLCYLPFIANYITNSMDGLWQETYHQAANWEISTGRWAWPFLDKARMGYSSEPFNSFLALLFIVIAAWLTISLFTEVTLKHYMYVLIVSISTTVFCFLSYRFQSPSFGAATLLPVVAAWFFLKDIDDKKKRLIADGIATFLLIITLGLYQSNFGIFFVIILASFMRSVLDAKEDKGFNIILRAIVSGLVSCVVYKVIWEIALKLRGIEAADYNGADASVLSMIKNIPVGIAKAYGGWNLRRSTFDSYYIFRPVRLLIYLFILGLLIHLGVTKLKGRGKSKVLYFVALLLMPLAENVCMLLAPGAGGVAIQMTAPTVMAGLVVLCLVDSYEVRLQKPIAIAVALLLYGNIYCVGTDLDAMVQGTKSMESVMDKVVTSLINEGAFDTDKQYVFVGNMSDNPLFYKNELWDRASDYAKGGQFWTAKECMAASYAGTLNRIGIKLDIANLEAYEKYLNDKDVKKMPCYPEEGSIVVDGDTVIVKMSNAYEVD